MSTILNLSNSFIAKGRTHFSVARSQFSDTFVRGLKWASILIASCVAPLVLLSLFLPGIISDTRIDPSLAAQTGLAIAVLTAGSKINWTDFSGNTNLDFSGSLKLTLLTLLLQVAALRYGRRIARNSTFPLYIPILLTSLGFAVTLFFSAYLLHGYQGFVSTPKISDLFRMALTVGVPITVGAIFRNFADQEGIGEFRNSLKALRIFAGLLVITTIVLIASYVAVEVIRPDFAFSQIPTKVKSADTNNLYLLAVLVAFVLNLPATIIAVLCFLTGISFAASIFATVSIPSGFSKISEYCGMSIIHCNFGDQAQLSANLNILNLIDSYSTAKRALFVAVFLFIIGLLISLASNFVSLPNSDNRPLHQRVLRSFLAYGSVAAYLAWLVNGEFAVKEQAKSTLDVNLNGASGSIGLASGSILAIAAIFAFLAGLATGKKSKPGLRVAFPRITRNFGAEQLTNKSSAKKWRAFGLTTTTVFVLTIVLSIAGALYELQYAKQHGPAFFAKNVESTLRNGDVVKFKKLTGNPKDHKWMNVKVMELALPKSTEKELAYEIKNLSKTKYVTGQLDPIISYSLGSGKDLSTYPLTLSGTTRPLFHFGLDKKWVNEQRTANHRWAIWLDKHFDDDYLTKAQFKFVPEPVKLTVRAGEFLPASVLKKLKINGKMSKVGTYNSVPGLYHFQVPGYGLIAKTDLKLATDKLTESVTVGADVNIPKKLESLLDKRLQSRIKSDCKIKPKATSFGSKCFWDYEIWDAKKLTSGKTMKSFDSYVLSNVKAQKLDCGKQLDYLTSASSLQRKISCTSTITFKARIKRNAQYEQGDPIYREVPVYTTERYDACPFNMYGYCWSYRQVQTGTETQFVGYKRGPLISPEKIVVGQYTAKLTHNIWISGSVGKNAKYTVDDVY